MNDAVVSVGMITYNHERFIEEAINSILNQETDFLYELVIAEDVSTDNTRAVIEAIIKDHPKGGLIKYFPQKNNLGMIPNFIFCLQQCKGKYIALCEGDDYWSDPLKLQKQVTFFRATDDYAISYHYTETYNETTKLYKPFISKESPDLSPEMIFACHNIPTASVMFKNVIKNIPAEFSRVYNGDTFVFCLLANETGKGAFFDKTIGPAVYRQHDSGNWSSLNWLLKYSHSLTTMSVLYQLFNKFRLPLKTRIHQMLLEAFSVMNKKEFRSYYKQHISFLLKQKQAGLIFLSLKTAVKKYF